MNYLSHYKTLKTLQFSHYDTCRRFFFEGHHHIKSPERNWPLQPKGFSDYEAAVVHSLTFMATYIAHMVNLLWYIK